MKQYSHSIKWNAPELGGSSVELGINFSKSGRVTGNLKVREQTKGGFVDDPGHKSPGFWLGGFSGRQAGTSFSAAGLNPGNMQVQITGDVSRSGVLSGTVLEMNLLGDKPSTFKNKFNMKVAVPEAKGADKRAVDSARKNQRQESGDDSGYSGADFSASTGQPSKFPWTAVAIGAPLALVGVGGIIWAMK